NERQALAAEAGLAIGKRVLVPAGERNVQVVAGSLGVVERLGHEVGLESLDRGQLTHRLLEHERAVGGLDRGAVVKIDLELSRREFVMGGGDAEPELIQRPVYASEGPGRVGLAPRRVGQTGARTVAPERLTVAAQEVELELRGGDRGHSERLHAGDRSAQRVT